MAYAHIPAEKRTKLEARAEQTIFVGYEPTSKQYRLYNPITKRLFVSSSVRFDENRPGGNLLQGENPIRGALPQEIGVELLQQLPETEPEPEREHEPEPEREPEPESEYETIELDIQHATRWQQETGIKVPQQQNSTGSYPQTGPSVVQLGETDDKSVDRMSAIIRNVEAKELRDAQGAKAT